MAGKSSLIGLWKSSPSAGIRTGISSVGRSKTTLTVHSRGLGGFGPCEVNFLNRGGLHLDRSLFNKIGGARLGPCNEP
jgi:hypothetical protein